MANHNRVPPSKDHPWYQRGTIAVAKKKASVAGCGGTAIALPPPETIAPPTHLQQYTQPSFEGDDDRFDFGEEDDDISMMEQLIQMGMDRG